MRKGAAEFDALTRALADAPAPPCTDDPRFVLEVNEIPKDELDDLVQICEGCPLRAFCAAYGETARPPAGVWAGQTYKLPRGAIREDSTNV